MDRSTEKVRIDKWLWSVRIFKSRSQASDACRSGKVTVGNSTVKPSYMIGIGETAGVKKGGFNLVFEVRKLIDKRVSAPLAQECYLNKTPQAEMNKFREWYVGKAQPEMRERGAGRPTKKERRELEEFKDEWLWEDW